MQNQPSGANTNPATAPTANPNDSTLGMPQASLIESFGGIQADSSTMPGARAGLAPESSIGEIHSLY